MTLPTYLSHANPLDCRPRACKRHLAEIDGLWSYDQVLGKHIRRQPHSHLSRPAATDIDVDRRGVSAGSAGCVDRNVQPVVAALRIATQLPGFRRIGGKLKSA